MRHRIARFLSLALMVCPTLAGAHALEPEKLFTNRFYNDKGTDGSAAISPHYSWSTSDNDFNDLVVENQSWGSVKALFRQ